MTDPTFNERARQCYIVVKAAQEIGAKREILAALTDYAAALIDARYTTEAAHLLAFVMNHPDIPFDTYDRADDLFILLEAELCPRVIADARADARSLTLRGAIDAAFAPLLDPPGSDHPANHAPRND